MLVASELGDATGPLELMIIGVRCAGAEAADALKTESQQALALRSSSVVYNDGGNNDSPVRMSKSTHALENEASHSLCLSPGVDHAP